jgi:hypothetical protein
LRVFSIVSHSAGTPKKWVRFESASVPEGLVRVIDREEE